jgi:anti-anti-sigma factor
VGNDTFDVTVADRDGRAIVFVHGEIDMSSGRLFQNALSAAQQRSPEVVVDVSGVTFMDSTGINALIRAYGRKPASGSLGVVGAKPAVQKVFDITGVSGLLTLEPETAEVAGSTAPEASDR